MCVYEVCDLQGECTTAKITLIVTEVTPMDCTEDPEAVNDEVTIAQDWAAVIANVLENDSAPDGCGTLTIDEILFDATHGSCTIVGNAISYTPNPGYHGQDNCIYSTCLENGRCDSADLTIMIEPATAPVEDIANVPQGLQTNLACTTTMNDPVLVETLAASVSLSNTGAHGTCTVTEEDNLILFTPDSGFAGYNEVSCCAIESLPSF